MKSILKYYILFLLYYILIPGPARRIIARPAAAKRQSQSLSRYWSRPDRPAPPRLTAFFFEVLCPNIGLTDVVRTKKKKQNIGQTNLMILRDV